MSADTTDPRFAALGEALAEALVARDEALVERDAYCASLREAQAQIAEARAELARLRADSPAARAAALMEPPDRVFPTDAELVTRAVRGAMRPGSARRSVVSARLGLGSTSAHALCLAVGVDPYEEMPQPELCPGCGRDMGGEE